jgi:hypothetical protein
VPCLQNGVIEPIGQAMIANFHERPDEMRSIAEHAVEDHEFHLAWRLNTSASAVTDATDGQVARAAKETVAITNEYFLRDFAQLLHEADAPQDDGGSQLGV